MLNSGYFFLFIIYVVWGTTYLAMRIGVAPGSGFAVFAFGATRCLIAALLLLLLAFFRGHALRPNRAELKTLVVTGLVGWVLGHGLVLAAEQYVDSSFAAVAVSAAPLWVMLLSAWWDKTRPSLANIGLVLLGFGGIVVLMVPALRQAEVKNWLGFLPLLLAPLSWSYSTLYLQKHPTTLSTLASSGYQHLFGGLGFLMLSWFYREPLPHPTTAAWGALAFLVFFGSVIAFTSYIKALSLLPARVVTTNTYVNPVIAVMLGAWLLHEAVTGWTIVSMLLVTLSVVGILQLSREREKKVWVAMPADPAASEK